MISPNGVTYANYWNAIKAGNRTHIRMTFTGQGIVLEDADISLNEKVVITDYLNSDTDLVFGKAVCKQFSASILNSSNLDGLSWTGEFQLEFGVEISSVTKWVTVGYFTGEKPKNVTTASVIAFTAYDRMKRFDKLIDELIPTLTYPITLNGLFSAICSFCDVPMYDSTHALSTKNRSFNSLPDLTGYSCRDVIAWISEACGCYATISNYGNAQMSWFEDNTGHSISADEEFAVETADFNEAMTWDEAEQYTWDEIEALTWNDVCGYQETYCCDQLLVKQMDTDLVINYPNPYGSNAYVITGNPFMVISSTSDVTNYVKPIYDRLASFGGYLPFEMRAIGNWCVEAGDVITVSINGNTYTVPIFVKTMRWNGMPMDDYETTGQYPRAVYPSETSKQQEISNKSIKIFVDGKYYDRKSGIEIDEDGVEITGHKYIRMNSGGELTLQGSTFTVDNSYFKVDSVNKFLQMISHYTFVNDQIDFALCFGSDYGLPELGVMSCIQAMQETRTVNGNTIVTYPVVWDTNYNYSLDSKQYKSRLEIGSVPFGLLPIEDPSDFQIMFGIRAEAYYLDEDLQMWRSTKSLCSFSVGEFSDKVITESLEAVNIDATNITYSSLQQNSSRDIKHDIQPLESVGNKIDRLRIVTFVYDKDPKEQKRTGLIYEDTKDVLPEICTDDESNKAINYVELIPMLVKEIQDLRKRVKDLEDRLEEN